MKWGQVIKENTLWKWQTRYISYAILKQIIKHISTAPSPQATTQNAEKLKLAFATILETDIFIVKSFFNDHEQTLRKQYDLLMMRCNGKDNTRRMCPPHGIMEGLSTLLTQLKELQHFAFINAEGFRKIIKKYDKRMATNIGEKYYPLLQNYNFYKREGLKQMIDTIANIVNINANKDRYNHHRHHRQPYSRIVSRGPMMHDTDDPMRLERFLDSAQIQQISQLLTQSIRSNKHEIIESIIEHFKAMNINGNTLKHMVNCTDGYLGNTALMTCCAAVSGSIRIAQLLIEHGADISIVNNYGRTALHIASQRGHNEMIKMLLHVMSETKQKQLIRQVDVDMHTALHLACLRKQYASSQLLIAFDDGIVNEPNAEGATPLMIVCDGGVATVDHEALILLMNALLKSCANINQRDWKLQSALHYACRSGNQACVDRLLKHSEIDPFVFNCNGESALHIAAYHGYVDILKSICEYCERISGDVCTPIYDHTDRKGRSALHLCTGNGYTQCTQYLLGIGANANIMDRNGCNAHSYALYNGIWNDDECPRQLQEDNENSKHVHNINGTIRMMYTPQRNDVSYMDAATTKVDLMVPSASLIGASGCIVKFRIQCDTSTNKDDLCIIGDCDALGNWNVTKGVKMYRNKMPTHTVSADELSEDEPQPYEHNDNFIDKSFMKPTTWIADILLPKGIEIKYRYITRRQSCNSLESYESLPTNRRAIIHESMIIDDGVFGIVTSSRSKSTTSIPRISSQPQLFSKLAVNVNNFDSDGDIIISRGGSPAAPPHVQQTSYIQSGWLVNDAQLQIRLGHNTLMQRRAPLVIHNNLYIDRIVIRSGYINKNRYRGIHRNVSLPIHPEYVQQTVYKFQSNYKQIAALCSLEFEFFARGASADAMNISRVFVLPSQIVSNCVGALTLPLSSGNGLLIGEFNFEYVLITPFTHRHCGNILFKTFKHQHAYSKKAIVIGHRGTGSHMSAELPGPRRTHIKENTILAFNTAQSFGADCVEFDVQLTKDKIPIIYHDFLFHVGTFNIPINKITFDELKQYNEAQKQTQKKHDEAHDTMNMHMNIKQFNSFLDDHICSLQDVFQLAPLRLGFNIEIKYPLYTERIAAGIECSVDINEYVDKILTCVFNHYYDTDTDTPSNRYIIFSSFHPDICIAVALKQPQFPVLFLTESGKSFYYDVRCQSLRNAIHFAKAHSLFGIVTDVKPILESPHLIPVVHKNGLILLTYGDENNDKRVIDLQMKYGIDGLISDHVQYVRHHLDSKYV